MNRVSKDIRIISQNTVRPVPLMRIRIHHHDLDARPMNLQIADRNCDVIENTISFSPVLKRVMGAPRHHCGHAILQGSMTRRPRRFDLRGTSLV